MAPGKEGEEPGPLCKAHFLAAAKRRANGGSARPYIIITIIPILEYNIILLQLY
jgi:hypothetical protein